MRARRAALALAVAVALLLGAQVHVRPLHLTHASFENALCACPVCLVTPAHATPAASPTSGPSFAELSFGEYC